MNFLSFLKLFLMHLVMSLGAFVLMMTISIGKKMEWEANAMPNFSTMEFRLSIFHSFAPTHLIAKLISMVCPMVQLFIVISDLRDWT